MVIDSKIRRYVDDVVLHLPVAVRKRAAEDLTETIMELAQEYAEGCDPDILHVRKAIRKLGTPEAAAQLWFELNGREAANERHALAGRAAAAMNTEKFAKMVSGLSWVLTVLAVLAVVLVVGGVVAVGTHTINTMLPIFVGGVLALVAVAGRGVVSFQN